MKIIGVFLTLIASVYALYSPSDDVVELTTSNFKSKVLDSDELWLVEFYAPWCGHCKSLAPQWKKAASNLMGVVNVGAVDMDQHQSVGGPYGIQGFPTIKVFGYNKNKPKDYNGGRDASSIVDFGMTALREMVKERQSGGSSSGGGQQRQQQSGGSGGKDEVVELNDDNFQKLVLDSDEPWLVEFFAPWCGHCKNLAPVWASVSRELKEKAGDAVKMGAVDATQNQFLGNKYGVRGYPTIKIFRKGSKDKPEDYQSGRDHSSILSAAMELYEENVEPPTINELVSAQVLEDNCVGKQMCIISFLPDILDTGASGRNEHLELLAKLGEKFKKQIWGWLWTPAGAQQKLEKDLRVGGSGYPTMVVIVAKKNLFTVLTAAFNEEGVVSFLNGISYGRGGRNSHSLPEEKLPEVVDCEPWDGKDGQLPEEDDIDLSDFKWDDEL